MIHWLFALLLFHSELWSFDLSYNTYWFLITIDLLVWWIVRVNCLPIEFYLIYLHAFRASRPLLIENESNIVVAFRLLEFICVQFAVIESWFFLHSVDCFPCFIIIGSLQGEAVEPAAAVVVHPLPRRWVAAAFIVIATTVPNWVTSELHSPVWEWKKDPRVAALLSRYIWAPVDLLIPNKCLIWVSLMAFRITQKKTERAARFDFWLHMRCVSQKSVDSFGHCNKIY